MAEQKVLLEIQGMTCEGCSQTIEHSLKGEQGIREVHIDWCCGFGDITFDREKTDAERVLGNPVFQGEYRAKLVAPGCC